MNFIDDFVGVVVVVVVVDVMAKKRFDDADDFQDLDRFDAIQKCLANPRLVILDGLEGGLELPPQRRVDVHAAGSDAQRRHKVDGGADAFHDAEVDSSGLPTARLMGSAGECVRTGY